MFQTSILEEAKFEVWSILGGVAMFLLLTGAGYFMIVS